MKVREYSPIKSIDESLKGILAELKKMNEPPQPNGYVQPKAESKPKHKAYK